MQDPERVNSFIRRAGDPEFARAMLLGLMIECPLGEDLCDCPIKGARNGSRAERFQWVRGKTDEECVQLYREHLAYYTTRKEEGDG